MALLNSRRKGSISEDDVSTILQRYTATTIVTLLQEVSQVASCALKIDWKTLVKRTATGITCPREYQMLWRHLAYRNKLLEKIEENAEPLDDDSDLEFEVEPVPQPTEDALSEAKACVKTILNPAGTDLSSTHNNTTVNENMPLGPFDKQPTARIFRGANNNCQAFDQKPNQPPMIGISSVDAADVAGSAPPKKKRKQWSKEEDADLIALVQKHGEKWEILKDDFKHDRTPHQLALRWGLIKKRQGQTNQGTVSKSTTSEQIRMTHEALSHALGGALPSFRSGANNVHSALQNSTGSMLTSTITEAKLNSTLLNPSSNPNQTLKSLPAVIPKPTKLAPKKQSAPCPTPQPQPQSQPTLKGSVGSLPRPISTANPNSIQAAAFAAGGRIANPSTARSLLEAAKSKNVVHIRSGGVSLSNKPIMAAHTTINISAVRAPSSTVQAHNLNQNSNSSPGSGGIQVSAHLKKVKGIAANVGEIETEVMDVDGKDALKLNNDDKGVIVNKENSKIEVRNDAAGCLISVEKPTGGIVSSNLKTIVPEKNGKENQTAVPSESKISDKENQTVVKTESKEKTGL